MSIFDELKDQWHQEAQRPSVQPTLDRSALEQIARTRARLQVNRAMQYFWGAFTLQLIVYALFSHVFIRFWGQSRIQWLCLTGILLYLPFTVMLLKKFKQIAQASPPSKESGDSVQKRIRDQYLNLETFYRFKKWYEYLLIPASTGLGIYLVFELYVPGGIGHYPVTALVLFVLFIIACVWAIWRENRNQFDKPINELRQLLSEFDN